MIALAASVLLTVYLLAPSFLFRCIFGLFVPLRIFVRSRSEEFYRAVIAAFVPLFLAWSLVWLIPIAQSHPFYVPNNTDASRRTDYELVVASAYSEQAFINSQKQVWPALTRSLRRQARLLSWYYLLIALEAMAFGTCVRKYGAWKRSKNFSRFADKVLLPHVAEWHVLLTPLVFPDRKATVKADILSSDGILYQGVVSQYFLDGDGLLSGLILTEPRRFDRRGYLMEKDKGTDPKSDEFWRPIPSAKLYLFADKISNINLNYQPETPSEDAVRSVVKQKTGTQGEVTVTFNPRPKSNS